MRSDSPTGLHEAETSQIAPTSAAAANRILISHTHVPTPYTIIYDMNIDHLKRWWPLLNVYGMSRSLPLGRSDRPRRPMYKGVGQWCTQQSRALLALASHWCNVFDAHTHTTHHGCIAVGWISQERRIRSRECFARAQGRAQH